MHGILSSYALERDRVSERYIEGVVKSERDNKRGGGEREKESQIYI